MKWYCWDEMEEVKRLKKKVKKLEAWIQQAKCYSIAFNSVQELFQKVQGGKEYEARREVNPEILEKLDKAKQDLLQAENTYKAKRKEFYENRRKKNGQPTTD